MKNAKYTLSISVEQNEELNKEIDRIIFERVKSAVRTQCDDVFNALLEREIPKIIQNRLGNIGSYDFTKFFTNAVSAHLYKENEQLESALEKVLNQRSSSIDMQISKSIMEHVERRLTFGLNEKVIKAVVEALLSNPDKEANNA